MLGHIACGQKGPPLAPIVYLPRPVSEVVAKRIENDIVLQFTVPTVNTDGTGPADLRRIEVYAHTGPLPAPTDFLKYGTLVASIDIKQPPEPEDGREQRAEGREQRAEGREQRAEPGAPTPDSEAAAKAEKEKELAAAKREAEAAAKAAADPEASLIEQGTKTTVRETLTAKHREIGPMPPTRPLPPPPSDAPVVVMEKIETPGTVNFELPPQRYYAIFPRQREPQPARTSCGADSGGAARAADSAGKNRPDIYGRYGFPELAGAA